MTASNMIRQWWTQSNRVALEAAQANLLQRFVRSADHHAVVAVPNPVVAGMNSVTFTSSSSTTMSRNNHQQQRIIVLAHGFGSGLGFFYRNIDELLHPSRASNNNNKSSAAAAGGGDDDTAVVTKVVAVDWLGMGGSDRPVCWSAPIRWSTNCWCDAGLSVAEAVDFFIDPFHEWMQAVVLRENLPVTLVGHSLGGYLAARYALKHHNNNNNHNNHNAPPQLLDKLILASPVGFAEPPANQYVGWSQFPTLSLRIMDALWSRNVTPQQLVRIMGGTRGRRNVQRVLRARMPTSLPDRDVEILADYLYHITVAAPSGEYAMNSLLAPVASPDLMGVYAREPLHGPIQTLTGPTTIRVLYGDHDWMRPRNETSARSALAQKTALHPKSHCSVEIIANAGHHLYLENPTEFVHHILR
jgi:pimeloyl-ACP methyl ester carboxylesterase